MATRRSTAENADRELVITRILDAPHSLVFKAWTEPEHLERWQGAPQGFTVTTHKSDIRPGGAFRVCMRSPEGVTLVAGRLSRDRGAGAACLPMPGSTPRGSRAMRRW